MPTETCSITAMSRTDYQMRRCPETATVYCCSTEHLLCPAHSKLHFAELGCSSSDHVAHRPGQKHYTI